MKALIIGGAGFIGSHTADALLRKGYEVRILDSFSTSIHRNGGVPRYLDDRIEVYKGDARDEKSTLPALRGCDFVLHMAAHQGYLDNFSLYFDTNVTSTALLYELIVREKLPIKKVLIASSQAIIGEGLYEDSHGNKLTPNMRSRSQLENSEWDIKAPDGYKEPLMWLPSSEEINNPQNQYALSKFSQEKVALNLGKRYEIPTVAMRYSIVQGSRQSIHNPYSGACRIFSLSFMNGKEPEIYEDGLQIRDFVNIYDVVSANILALEDDSANGEVFNVGSEKATSIVELATEIANIFGVKGYQPNVSGKYRYGDVRHLFSDTNRLKKLGWKPMYSIQDSIEQYRDWLKEMLGSSQSNRILS